MYYLLELDHYLNNKTCTECLDVVKEMERDSTLPLNDFLQLGEERANGPSLYFYQTILVVSYVSYSGGYFIFYYPAGRGKENLQVRSLFSEPLEWCEIPVSSGIATSLSGVIMDYV